MHGMCKCPHHLVNKVLLVLAWVAGVLFFWTSWRTVLVWGWDFDYYAWSVVVLVLLAHASKYCGCCRWHGMMKSMNGGDNMCSHGMGCKCSDCDRCK